MGVDLKCGRFPICPAMSRFVPVCPLLSFLAPGTRTNRNRRGQTGTKRDISGHMGKRPHLGSPHLALLENDKSQIASDLTSRRPHRKSFHQIALGKLKSHFHIARFAIRASVQIAVRFRNAEFLYNKSEH